MLQKFSLIPNTNVIQSFSLAVSARTSVFHLWCSCFMFNCNLQIPWGSLINFINIIHLRGSWPAQIGFPWVQHLPNFQSTVARKGGHPEQHFCLYVSHLIKTVSSTRPKLTTDFSRLLLKVNFLPRWYGNLRKAVDVKELARQHTKIHAFSTVGGRMQSSKSS